MTDDARDPVVAAVERSDRFVADEDGYRYEGTPFDAAVTATEAADGVRVTASVDVPTLDAAVPGDDVADVVVDGWFETFDRRVADAFDVARTSDHEPVDVERSDDRVTVTLRFTASSPDRALDDARTVIDFVEGTYVQGVVPGYDYRDPVAGLLADARRTHERAVEDGDSR